MSDYAKWLGRPYRAGQTDCYGLVRDYLFDTYGLLLPNFARPNEFWEDEGLDLYQLYKKIGAEIVIDQPLEVGDVLVMPLGTHRNTHAAVVVEGNQILHHLPNVRSSLDPIYPRWFPRTNVVFRHPYVTQQRKQQESQVHVHEVLDVQLFRDPKFQDQVAKVMDRGDGTMRDHQSQKPDPDPR